MNDILSLTEALINAVANNIRGVNAWMPNGHARATREIDALILAERERVALRCAEIAGEATRGTGAGGYIMDRIRAEFIAKDGSGGEKRRSDENAH